MEIARIGPDTLMINAGGGIRYQGRQSQAIATLQVAGTWYEIGDSGMSPAW